MEKHEKKEMIIFFLNHYIKLNLGMNDIFVSIVELIQSNKKMSLKQFNSIIKFLEVEPIFVKNNKNRMFINLFFSDFYICKTIKNKKKVKYESNTISLNRFYR